MESEVLAVSKFITLHVSDAAYPLNADGWCALMVCLNYLL